MAPPGDHLYSRLAINYIIQPIILLTNSFLYSFYLLYRVWYRLPSLDISFILVHRGLDGMACIGRYGLNWTVWPELDGMA